MLTAITLSNFKAFAKPQRIPIRPLTLIYGANSSGKSSIIHSLLLAKHAAETGELDAHRTNAGGESVDLGGFRQYIHRREAARRMEWSAELDTTAFRGPLGEMLAPVRELSVSVAVGISLDNEGRPIPGAEPTVHAYEMLADKKSVLRMSRRGDGKLQLDRLDHEHPVLHQVVRAIVQTSTTTETLLPDDYSGLADAIAAIVPEIEVAVGSLFPSGIRAPDSMFGDQQGMLFPVSRGKRSEDLAAAIRLFLPRALDGLIGGVSKAVTGELENLRYLGPLRSYPPRHLAFSQDQDRNWFAGGGYAWDIVRRDGKVREAVNTWLSNPDRLQTPYELVLRDLVAIDDLESPLFEGVEALSSEIGDKYFKFWDEVRQYALQGKREQENLAQLGAAADSVKLEIDAEIEALKLRDRIRAAEIEKLNELILVDRRSSTIVSHRDVGIGVSQVLPVLVSAYGSKKQLIAIEQPEIHLHPALQADLGDVFIESALGEHQNRFIIETHSEHLLLRIMRRLRETSASKKRKGAHIRPEDVSVLFVLPKGAASVVQHLELDEEGALLDPWPGGFFEEGFRERFS